MESQMKLKTLQNGIRNDYLDPNQVSAFSAAGLFVSKLRTSLSDNSVDMLCFMRSHLLKKWKKWPTIRNIYLWKLTEINQLTGYFFPN